MFSIETDAPDDDGVRFAMSPVETSLNLTWTPEADDILRAAIEAEAEQEVEMGPLPTGPGWDPYLGVGRGVTVRMEEYVLVGTIVRSENGYVTARVRVART